MELDKIFVIAFCFHQKRKVLLMHTELFERRIMKMF